MKIRAYLALLAAAVAVPVAMVSGWSLNMLSESGQAAALQTMHATVRAKVQGIDRELAATEARLRVFAVSRELVSGDMAALHANMRSAGRPPAEGWMLVLDENGRQLLNTLVPFRTDLPVIASREQLEQLFALDRTWVSNLSHGPVAGRPTVVAALPVHLGNGRRYVLMESMTPALFDRLLREGRLAEGSTVALIDRDGKFIARTVNSASMLGKTARPELLEAAADRKSGRIRHRTWEGMQTWDVFSHTEYGNWTVAVASPVEVIEGEGRRAMAISAFGFVGALALGILLAWLFGRRLVAAIDGVAHSAALLVKGEPPLPVNTSLDEIRKLQEAMQDGGRLLSAERASRLQAEQERQHLLEMEQRARLQAEEESQSKDAFLAMLGHELRNPLSAISAGIAVIRAAGTHTEAAARANDIIGRQSAHLERIVDDLLDTARMLAGKIKLVKQPLDLADALQSCLDALHSTGRLQGYRLQVHAQSLLIDGDPARIDQIINNLLNNAVKYTPVGGEIMVSLRREQDSAVLEVADNGVGMQPELLARVFEPFFQGKVSLDRSQGGLGVGLTLVRKLAELHGGSVRASSDGEGAGSRFTVRLPLLSTGGEQGDSTGAVIAVSGARLLLVEDNPDARDMTAELLRLSGYQVSVAENGLEGLRLARESPHAAGIIDIGLPDISGYDVARQLRQSPSTRSMGLVALTGYGLQSDIQHALEAGFDIHLVKPVNHQKLIEAVERARANRNQTA